jgi:hypothetical protein
MRRRTVLSGLAALALPMPAALSYAGFRLVRAAHGEPEFPDEIVLPAGYAFVPGATYQAASRAEFTGFVQGARNDAGVPITVRWPRQPLRAVIAGEHRLPMQRDRHGVTFTLPVWRASAVADSPTVQVWSHLGQPASGLYWHVEHNDPDRAAGVWPAVAWPVVETRAVIAFMVASEAILQDSGAVLRARQRQHFFALMGFETNNMLHQDNPPHWHLSYYPGPTMAAPKQTVPHFWVDAGGRVFYNGQDVQGAGRTPYRVGDPAPIFDAEGGLLLVTTIRADGGLDIDVPGAPRYSIVPLVGGAFDGTALVLRADQPWRTVVIDDNYRTGLLHTRVDETPASYRYDPLTGVIITPAPAEPDTDG